MVDSFDGGLLRVLLQGPRALPNDVERLEAFLDVVRYLLEEKATEHDADMQAERLRQSEVAMLLDLEDRITEKIAEVPVMTVCGVLRKLEIWSRLGDTSDPYEMTPRDAIILSARRDLERIIAIARVTQGGSCASCTAAGL